MALAEFYQDSLTLQVSSIRQELDNATSLEQIRDIVKETGTLVGEGKMPKLFGVFLVCHAQSRITSLNETFYRDLFNI